MIVGRHVSHPSQVRDHVIDTLRRELVGPAPGYPAVQLDGEEILRPQDPPRYRYSCGILFPRGVTYSGSLDATEEASGIEDADAIEQEDHAMEETDADPDGDTPAGEGPAGESEVELNTSSMFLPSSMGVSFLADVSGGLRIEANWGTYRKVAVKGFPSHRDDEVPELWFRTPLTLSLDVTASELGSSSSVATLRRTISPADSSGQLALDVISRPWSDRLNSSRSRF